tara:strand:+ start:4843 stop:5946 length:1104 start_codon:yes stop_codon:yes gene_type:complete
MTWNWQQKDWPHFRYDAKIVADLERQFYQNSGHLLGTYQHVNKEDKDTLTVALISDEALKTSEIEGEFLDRYSVQSSIRRHLGLTNDTSKILPAEDGIAKVIVDLYRNYEEPLTHEILFTWHRLITQGRRDLEFVGQYRAHGDPMQVISGAVHKPKIHFEAPPSSSIPQEMKTFITWFNESAPSGTHPLPALTRASIAHLYFVCIHPFEDGNGRIGRAIAEKALAQCLSAPSLIALSLTIQKNKKAYYDNLEKANKSNEVSGWLHYFSSTLVQAQQSAQEWVNFLIQKTKLYDQFKDQLNPRQAKALARIFQEGPEGFQGGLSASNYKAITKAPHATVTRDLKDLVEQGIFKQTGTFKSTRYHLVLE